MGRPGPRHASFGLGAHYCLGAGRVRLEARLVFAALLDRYPWLGSIVMEPVWRSDHVALRALESLVVDLDPPRR